MNTNEALHLADSISWKSVEKDNMEFEAHVTTYQVEAIRYLVDWVKREFL